MSESLRLIVGLGNPGSQYNKTRHNAGAEFVEQLAQHLHTPLQTEKRYHGLYAKAFLGQQEIHLLIPTTFMNLSGQSVQALSSYFKIPVESILVAHDELDLDPGVARLKQGGGHGGHNGLRDIISKFGGNKEFMRLRIGIGHPGNAKLVHDFVLGKVPSSERKLMEAAIDESLHCLPILSEQGIAKAMNRLHTFRA